MTVTAPPRSTPASAAAATGQWRGLTFRSFIICLFALLLMGMWNEYQICYLSGASLLENSPPNGAISTLVIVLVIGAVLYRLRRNFGLATAELVVIYAALLAAAPLMTQGLWHRLFGLMAAIPHDQDFKTYESLPSMLWPHGDNLVINGRFVEGLDGFTVKGGTPGWEEVAWKDRSWRCPQLSNGADSDGQSTLALTLDRRRHHREILVPGENYLFSCLVKVDGLMQGSYYFVKMSVDGGAQRTLYLNAINTTASFANPGGFRRIGLSSIIIPSGITRQLTFTIGLHGAGTLTVHDVEFFNVQAVEGAYAGVKVAQGSRYDALPDNERDFTLRKPEHMLSPAGLGYLLRGFIPLAQWVRPMVAWTLLIGALFMGFFGCNVLMRKHWVESERFTFPMNIFPRQFFGGEAAAFGGLLRRLFRNRLLWIGFAVMLPLVLLKGLHYYIPNVPEPFFTQSLALSSLVTHPLLKAFLQNANMQIVFSVFAIALLIETDLLFSIWVYFLLFQLWYVCGQLFNFNRYEGYPWDHQQTIGAFIAFAILAVIAARRHLGQVFRQVFRGGPALDAAEAVPYRAAMLMILAAVVILAAWGWWTKMGVLASLLYFGWILICGLTASKVRAEAGLPFGYWMPYFGMFYVAALGGFAIFGATGMLVATICSGFMCVSCFLYLAPVQVEMMELARHFKVRPRDIGYGLFLGLLGGLFIGGFTFLSWTYGKGADNFANYFFYRQGWYFNGFRGQEAAIDGAFLSNNLAIPGAAPLDFVHNVNAKGIGVGFLITFLLSGLRSLFPWFPLHPLGYVVASTYFVRTFWFVALLAWTIRMVVLRIGGTHSVRQGLIPFSVGMFLACAASIIIFEITGFILQGMGFTRVYCQWP